MPSKESSDLPVEGPGQTFTPLDKPKQHLNYAAISLINSLGAGSKIKAISYVNPEQFWFTQGGTSI